MNELCRLFPFTEGMNEALTRYTDRKRAAIFCDYFILAIKSTFCNNLSVLKLNL